MPDSNTIHAVATCLDCGWKEEDYLKDVSSLAHDHAKNNRHKVELELGIYIDGTKPSSRLKSFGMVEDGYEDYSHNLKTTEDKE
jgi:hypothetical protein